MSTTTAVILALGTLLGLMTVRVPVAFSLLGAGVVGLVTVSGFGTTSSTLAAVPYSAMASYSLFVIPMFILMGLLVLRARLAEDIFGLASALLRWLPGGLAIATIGACAGFAAVTGSSVATVATMGRLSVNEMQRYGYSRTFAAGVVGAAGTLGVLIPPSIVLVLFGIVTRESIGRLLIAGIVPGVISALAYAALVAGLALRGAGGTPERIPAAAGGASDPTPSEGVPDPQRHDPASEATAVVHEPPASEGPTRRTHVVAAVQVAVIFLIVVGGIYSGTFTATESGAVGAFFALLLLIFRTARQPLGVLRRFRDAVKESMSLTAMAFAILLGATFFSQFLVVARVPSSFANLVTDLDLAPVVVVALLLLALVPLGMVLDGISIVVIAAPLLYVPVTALGYSGVWFGVMMVKFIELGLVTPPVGMNAYVVAGTVPDLELEQVFRGLLPFILVDVAVIALLFAFPGLVTWLPDRML